MEFQPPETIIPYVYQVCLKTGLNGSTMSFTTPQQQMRYDMNTTLRSLVEKHTLFVGTAVNTGSLVKDENIGTSFPVNLTWSQRKT
jgi:hypothetical protein